MEPISRTCLEWAIVSVSVNRQRIMDRIVRVSDEVLEEEQLSEMILEIDIPDA